jgi:hypothetical protein
MAISSTLWRTISEPDFGLRAANVVFRLKRIDRGGFQQLAGVVDHCDFHAGADAGIESDRGARTGRRRQQQILEIAREDRNGLFFGALAQLGHQVDRQRERELHPPGPARDIHQPFVGGPGIRADRVGVGNHLLDRLHRRGAVGIDLDIDRQESPRSSPRSMASARWPGTVAQRSVWSK